MRPQTKNDRDSSPGCPRQRRQSPQESDFVEGHHSGFHPPARVRVPQGGEKRGRGRLFLALVPDSLKSICTAAARVRGNPGRDRTTSSPSDCASSTKASRLLPGSGAAGAPRSERAPCARSSHGGPWPKSGPRNISRLFSRSQPVDGSGCGRGRPHRPARRLALHRSSPASCAPLRPASHGDRATIPLCASVPLWFNSQPLHGSRRPFLTEPPPKTDTSPVDRGGKVDIESRQGRPPARRFPARCGRLPSTGDGVGETPYPGRRASPLCSYLARGPRRSKKARTSRGSPWPKIQLVSPPTFTKPHSRVLRAPAAGAPRQPGDHPPLCLGVSVVRFSTAPRQPAFPVRGPVPRVLLLPSPLPLIPANVSSAVAAGLP